jgi:hypothetical protein
MITLPIDHAQKARADIERVFGRSAFSEFFDRLSTEILGPRSGPGPNSLSRPLKFVSGPRDDTWASRAEASGLPRSIELLRSSCGRRQQFGQPDEIVGCHGQNEFEP